MTEIYILDCEHEAIRIPKSENNIGAASAKHFDSLVGVLSLDDLLLWGLETLANPTVYGIVMAHS